MSVSPKILVAGASGQLARALQAEARLREGKFSLTALGRPSLDITDPASIEAAVIRERPAIVINAAAYTAVDRAESEPGAAFALNRDGAASLAQITAQNGAALIHVSTDYVFDGTKPRAYAEEDAPNPQSVYGRSKHEGELAVAAANPRHLIVRTSWVYSEYGSNFLKTMLRLARERPELRVVSDQYGNPTYARDLAAAILDLAENLAGRNDEAWGVYHLAGSGDASWRDFAARIIACGAQYGCPQVPVMPIPSADYPAEAKRPANSRLDCTKAARMFGVALPRWEDGVVRCLSRLHPAAEAAAELSDELHTNPSGDAP